MQETTHNTQRHRLLMPQQPHRNTLKTTQNCFESYNNQQPPLHCGSKLRNDKCCIFFKKKW